MKINGHKLRDAIRDFETARDKSIASLSTSLDSGTMIEIIECIDSHERSIARLQALQTVYNTINSFEFDGETVTMAEAVKMIGGLERVSTKWKKAASITNDEQIIDRSRKAASNVSKMRELMITANSVEIDVPGLTDSDIL